MGHGRAERADALLLYMYQNGENRQFYDIDLPEDTRICIGALLKQGRVKKVRRPSQKPLYYLSSSGIRLGKRLLELQEEA